MKANLFTYYALLILGVAVMLLALWLSFALTLAPHLRYEVTSLIGLAGFGVATLARNFRPKS